MRPNGLHTVLLVQLASCATAGEGGFHCWTEALGAIRCQWPAEWDTEAKVVYAKTHARDQEPLQDCRPDEQLTTATQVGCTTRSANSFIEYTLRLLDRNNKKLAQIKKFVGGNYLKIADPVIDFQAERYGNGTVHLTWNYNSSQKFLNSLHGDRIVLKLLYRPFMQSGAYAERILGFQKDLQRELYLNDLPNSDVLELCVRVKKNDSLVASWSPCSNKAILRPVNLPTRAPSSLPVNVTLNPNDEKQNRLKHKVVALSTGLVLFALFAIAALLLKYNWRRIKHSILPPIPSPTVIFISPLEDHQVHASVAGALRNNEFERNDILERSMADQTLELTNRTEITFLSHNDTIAENNRSAGSGSYRDSVVQSNSSQKSLDSGFGAPEPSTSEQETTPILADCPTSSTRQSPSALL